MFCFAPHLSEQVFLCIPQLNDVFLGGGEGVDTIFGTEPVGVDHDIIYRTSHVHVSGQWVWPHLHEYN